MSQAKHAARAAILVLGLAAAVPAAAHGQASTAPVVVTGGATDRTTTTATLRGRVNPKGAQTTYFFQYGVSRQYSAQTPVAAAGNGRTRVRVGAALTGLAPGTVYHYRLVAENRNGVVRGKDRTFATLREPFGLTLAAVPNPVPFNGSTVVRGELTGTGNTGQQVQLLTNPWPYTQGFAPAANPQVTDANGSFAFPLLAVPINTQIRVVMPERPEVVSPIDTIGVRVRVRSKARPKRVRKGRRVRFTGTVRPAIDGQRLVVQKLVDGAWVTKGSMTARPRQGGGRSEFRRRLRIFRGGRFRVATSIANNAYVDDAGSPKRIRVRRR